MKLRRTVQGEITVHDEAIDGPCVDGDRMGPGPDAEALKGLVRAQVHGVRPPSGVRPGCVLTIGRGPGRRGIRDHGGDVQRVANVGGRRYGYAFIEGGIPTPPRAGGLDQPARFDDPGGARRIPREPNVTNRTEGTADLSAAAQPDVPCGPYIAVDGRGSAEDDICAGVEGPHGGPCPSQGHMVRTLRGIPGIDGPGPAQRHTVTSHYRSGERRTRARFTPGILHLHSPNLASICVRPAGHDEDHAVPVKGHRLHPPGGRAMGLSGG